MIILPPRFFYRCTVVLVVFTLFFVSAALQTPNVLANTTNAIWGGRAEFFQLLIESLGSGRPVDTAVQVEDTHSPGDLQTPNEALGCTIGEFDDDGKPCTVYPFWLYSGSGLLMSEENPGLLDARRINGQGFMKMVRSFESSTGSATASGPASSTPLYLHGIFPLEQSVVYQQIAPRDVDAYTLGEIKELLGVYPRMWQSSTLLAALGAPDDEGRWAVNQLVASFDVLFNTAPLTAGDIALSVVLSDTVLVESLFEGVATLYDSSRRKSSPALALAVESLPKNNTSPSFDTWLEEGKRRNRAYHNPGLVLLPLYDTFHPQLAGLLRLKADFVCKNHYDSGQVENPVFDTAFVADRWKRDCGSLSTPVNAGTAMYMAQGPFADRTFGAREVSNSGSTVTWQSSLPLKNDLARESIGHQNTDHMDWFTATAHCNARGGRLPRTDELLHMVAETVRTPATSPFFAEESSYRSWRYPNGALVWTGDLVSANDVSNPSSDINRARATAVYLPSRRSEINNEQIVLIPGYMGAPLSCSHSIPMIHGGRRFTNWSADSRGIAWNASALCAVELGYQSSNSFRTHHKGPVHGGRSTISMVPATTPSPVLSDQEFLPSAFSNDYASSGLGPARNEHDNPVTVALCVYE